MMHSYIDEKYMVHFFESLLKSQRFSEEARQGESILDFFKGKTDLFLDTDFSAVKDKIDKPYRSVIETLITQLTTGRNSTNIYQDQKKQFSILGNKNVYSKLKFPFVSFWLGSRYRHPIERLRDNSPYYFLSKDDDMEIWKNFSKSKTLYVGSETNPDSTDILNSWEEIKKFAHPFNDIIINDHFSFQDKTGIEENIIPMISGLSIKNNKIENVLIFTEKDRILNDSLGDTYGLVEKLLKEHGLEPNIKIYLSYKTPHGRYTITNNLFIEFGNSMDFFDKEKNLKSKGKLNDSSVRIMPIFEVNQSQLKSILGWLKNLSLTIKDDMCYGERSKSILDLFFK